MLGTLCVEKSINPRQNNFFFLSPSFSPLWNSWWMCYFSFYSCLLLLHALFFATQAVIFVGLFCRSNGAPNHWSSACAAVARPFSIVAFLPYTHVEEQHKNNSFFFFPGLLGHLLRFCWGVIASHVLKETNWPAGLIERNRHAENIPEMVDLKKNSWWCWQVLLTKICGALDPISVHKGANYSLILFLPFFFGCFVLHPPTHNTM